MEFTQTYSTEIDIIGHRCLKEPIGEAVPDGAMIIDLLVDNKHKISVAAFDITDLSTYTNIYDEDMLDIDVEALGTNVFSSNENFYSMIYIMIRSYCEYNGLPKGYMDPSANSYMVNQIKENLCSGKTRGVLYEDDTFFCTSYKLTCREIILNNRFFTMRMEINPLNSLESCMSSFANEFNSIIDGKYYIPSTRLLGC